MEWILLERLFLVLFEKLCSKWTFKTGGKQYNKQVVETQLRVATTVKYSAKRERKNETLKTDRLIQGDCFKNTVPLNTGSTDHTNVF